MTATTADLNYSYYGLPLTPAIAQELISELFAGRTAKRQEIVDAVVDAHRVRGGTQATAVNVSHTIKKSLQELKRKKLASNPSSGYWRIKGITAPPAIQPALISAEVQPIPADKVIGTGSSSVYVYFLPVYETQAISLGQDRWLCKIGRSDRDPLLRILSQTGTALPEKPRIALLIKTHDPSSLEAAIHNILRLRSRWSDTSPGAEWFQTNPAEVEAIVKFIGIE